MKVVAFILLSFVCNFVVATENQYWFTQRLDHFNNLNSGEFQQKYYVLDDYYQPTWNPPPPIFLYINGEGMIISRSIYIMI